MSEQIAFPDVIVERIDPRGAAFAVRIPYIVRNGAAVIEAQAAFAAAEMLRYAADEHYGGGMPFPAVKKVRRRKRLNA